MSPILGIWASSKAVAAADTGAMFPLQVVTVGAAGASSVTFTNIPNTYAHLQIRGIAASLRAATQDTLKIRFNSDTGANYSNHALLGNGSSASAGSGTNTTNMECYQFPGTSYPSIFGAIIMDILDYSNTNKYKTLRILTGTEPNSSTSCSVGLFSGSWRNTNAVTSVTLYMDSANIAQYSQFALYAVKGAA